MAADLSNLYVTGNGSLVALLPAMSNQQGHGQQLQQQGHGATLTDLDGPLAHMLLQQLRGNGGGTVQLATNGGLTLPLTHAQQQEPKGDSGMGQGPEGQLTLQRLLQALGGNGAGQSGLLLGQQHAPLPQLQLSMLPQQQQQQQHHDHMGQGHRRSNSQQSPSNSDSQSPPPSGPGHHGHHYGINKPSAKEKNRMAQRRFRERQKDLITNLKQESEVLKSKVASDAKLIRDLTEENQLLKAKLEAYAALVHSNLSGSEQLPPLNKDMQQQMEQQQQMGGREQGGRMMG